ncbi:MAG: DUF3108 domain-containing protein [Phycisphaerales bacterium]|nr:DUF3108 domain-containing protein [Phycisphaerales bacterium]
MRSLLVIFFLLGVFLLRAQIIDSCSIKNTTIGGAENISFDVNYKWGIINLNAGVANFTCKLEMFKDRPVFHLIGVGTSNSKYDWIFKVRDTYETYIDTMSMQPARFVRRVHEGGTQFYENVFFDKAHSLAITETKTFPVPNCIQDILSSMCYARNINFDTFKINQKVYFQVFLDNEVQNIFIKYLGKAILKTRIGKINTIKFSPLLLKGTMFQGGEDAMTIWVTDDDNHIPVRIESPIIVGSVRVDLSDYYNLLHPFSALINQKKKTE